MHHRRLIIKGRVFLRNNRIAFIILQWLRNPILIGRYRKIWYLLLLPRQPQQLYRIIRITFLQYLLSITLPRIPWRRRHIRPTIRPVSLRLHTNTDLLTRLGSVLLLQNVIGTGSRAAVNLVCLRAPGRDVGVSFRVYVWTVADLLLEDGRLNYRVLFLLMDSYLLCVLREDLRIIAAHFMLSEFQNV